MKPLDIVEDQPGKGNDHEDDEGDGHKHDRGSGHVFLQVPWVPMVMYMVTVMFSSRLTISFPWAQESLLPLMSSTPVVRGQQVLRG